MLTIAQPFAALALKTGPLNSWGYDPILSPPNGKPDLSNSPLLKRTSVAITRFFLDGEPVDKCGSTNGADPIGPLGDN